MGNGLSTQRTRRKVSQEHVAKKLGVTQSAISQWESGETMPSADKLKAIAELYQCTVDDLLAEDQGE